MFVNFVESGFPVGEVGLFGVPAEEEFGKFSDACHEGLDFFFGEVLNFIGADKFGREVEASGKVNRANCDSVVGLESVDLVFV